MDNHSDPFVQPTTTSSPQHLELAPRPSGLLAQRRTAIPTSPSPIRATKAVPLAVPKLSRSAPRPIPRRAATDHFKVCDDSNDEDSPPSTPIHPMTAPLRAGFIGAGFPFEKPRPKSERKPSVEGFILWGSDDDEPIVKKSRSVDFSSGSRPGGFLGRDTSSLTEEEHEEQAWRNITSGGFGYAMPKSHNSPSPDVLPEPDF